MLARRTHTTHLLIALLGAALLGPSTQAAGIRWRTNVDAAKIEANQTGKLVLLHFYTPSCGPCKKLERDVFSQPQIVAAMERDYVPVKLNADESPALAHAYQIQRVPSEVVLTPQGNVVQKLGCPLEPGAYGTQLANVAQYHHKRTANRTVSAQTPMHSAYAGLKITPSANSHSASAAAQPPSARPAPAMPAVTQNPYFNQATPAPQPTQQIVTAARQQPRPQQTKPPQPSVAALPTNAMPSSYRNAAAPQPPMPTVQQQVRPAAATAPSVSTSATTHAATQPAQHQMPTAAPAASWPPQLPAGTPALAFDGYSPVSLKTSKKWVRGQQAFGAIHRDRTYLFTSNLERQQFLADPDAYSPVFSGNDPVKMLEDNKQIAGSRRFGFEYRGAFYLFSSQETMTRFANDPDRYSAGVRLAMDRMDSAASGGTIRR